MVSTTASMTVLWCAVIAAVILPLADSFTTTPASRYFQSTAASRSTINLNRHRRSFLTAAAAAAPSIQQENGTDCLTTPTSSSLKNDEMIIQTTTNNTVGAFPEMVEVMSTATADMSFDDENDQAKESIVVSKSNNNSGGKRHRLRNALPDILRGSRSKNKNNNDDKDEEDAALLDKQILSTAVPSMMNLAVVPLVNAVDTFWVGRMGIALALAGQAAANQAFFTVYFLVAFIPTITAPLVASAVASGNEEEAKKRVSESIFLCNVLGALGTLFLVAFPRIALSSVLPTGSTAAMDYAAPYLRFRGWGLLGALISATGFAAYRGTLDTVTPLKVSLATNLLNLVLDPLLIFATPLRVAGAAVATALSETVSGLTYLKLLLRSNLVSLKLLFRQPPAWSSLRPLITSGLSVLGRQLVLNLGMLAAARRAQSMDPTTGVAAAAYGIVMQMYVVGVVVHVAMQGTAAALVPAAVATSNDSMTSTSTSTESSTQVATAVDSGKDRARQVADRTFSWGIIVGMILAVAQWIALPFLVPLFSTLPDVQQAVHRPALILSLLHIVNGPVFVGEGVMLGLGCFRDLMLITAAGIVTMVGCLATPALGSRLDGILVSFLIFSAVQAVGVVAHYLRIGPLAVKRSNKKERMPRKALRARWNGLRAAFSTR